MRSLASCCGIIVAILLADASSSAQALWCAAYRNGGNNCGFYTHEQCQAAISGVGGFCNQSPEDTPSTVRSTQRAKAPAKQDKKATVRQPRQPATASPAAKQIAPAAATPPAASVTAPATTPKIASATALDRKAFDNARKLIIEGQFDAGLSAMQALGSDNHPDVASYIGLAHRKLGRNEEARSWYDKALAADPKHLQTLAFYGVLRAEQGDVAGARTDLQKIRSICGNTNCNEYVGLAGVIAAKSQ